MVIVPDYTCYLVTDSRLLKAGTLEDAVEAACRGGVTLVQLREKGASRDELAEKAHSIKRVTDSFGVGLIVNDDPVVARDVDALGVHVGKDDMGVREAREILGPEKVVGASARTVADALRAQADGADYLGIGAMASTSTKPDADVITIGRLREIIDAVDIPCVAIGGISEETIPPLLGIGLAGFAIVSAIMAAEDIESATRRIRSIIK